MAKHKLSIKQIAEACGVSISTVSRTLSNSGRISNETRSQIMDYIKINDSSYLNNTYNQHLIGVVIPYLTNNIYANILADLEERFSSIGYSIVICESNYDYNLERQKILQLVSLNVAGIISIGAANKTLHKEEVNNIPLVTINGGSPFITGTPYAVISSDDFIGGVLATEELINKGCKNILFLDNTIYEEQNIFSLKYQGYCSALKKHNIPILDEYKVGTLKKTVNSIEDAQHIIEYMLAKNFKFDGVFAGSDRKALGVLFALNLHNKHCPDDVKIVGYDDSDLASYFSISSIYQNANVLGNQAFIQMTRAFEDLSPLKDPIILPVSITRRRSTSN